MTIDDFDNIDPENENPRPPVRNTENMIHYMGRYFHRGAWYPVEFWATDEKDAKVICQKLGRVQLMGATVYRHPPTPGCTVLLISMFLGVLITYLLMR